MHLKLKKSIVVFLEECFKTNEILLERAGKKAKYFTVAVPSLTFSSNIRVPFYLFIIIIVVACVCVYIRYKNMIINYVQIIFSSLFSSIKSVRLAGPSLSFCNRLSNTKSLAELTADEPFSQHVLVLNDL